MTDHRERFYAKSIFGISVTILLIGALCIPCGVIALYYSLATVCIHKPYYDNYNNDNYRYNHYGNHDITTTATTTVTAEVTNCRYYGSIFGAGIWVGIVYIAMGVVGIVASKTKTTCMIMTLMILSWPCFFISIAGIGFGFYSQFDGTYDLINNRPVEMIIANGVLSFLAVSVTIMDILIFAFTCRALCCVKSTVHYTELVDKEPNPATTGMWPNNIQMPPTMQMPTSYNADNSGQMMPGTGPQMMLVVPDGKGGFVPFQAANIAQVNKPYTEAPTQSTAQA